MPIQGRSRSAIRRGDVARRDGSWRRTAVPHDLVRWAASRLATALLAWFAAIAAPASAQLPTGNLFVTTTDSNGAALAGVTVSLSGMGANRAQVTDRLGQARFLALDPGRFSLAAELEGFAPVEHPNVDVRVNHSTAVSLALLPAVEETLTITSESPLLDERALRVGTSLPQVELERIPSARDPWALLHQTPGVLVDRVNVGGNESGQQSGFYAPGVFGTQNVFLLDGVEITDMRGLGASSSYFDFDQFAEMQVSTGGTDVTKGTAGVALNLVTKRGTNDFRGSARFYSTKANGYFGGGLAQSQPNVDPRELGSAALCEEAGLTCADQHLPGGASGVPAGNLYVAPRMREIEDYGFEAGGPMLRDRLWLWGSWGQNDIQIDAVSGIADDTLLENQSVKVNAQLTSGNSAVASWNNGDKQKFGRGASRVRPRATTWDQRGPSGVYRLEDSHVLSSSLFVTGSYSFSDLGFQLAAEGGVGPEGPESWRRSDGVWQDNYQSGGTDEASDELELDGSYFFRRGGGSHELRVGGRFRTYESFSAFTWPGRNAYTFITPRARFLVAMRGVGTPAKLEYGSLWAQDTIALGRFTVNLGVRYDHQDGANEPYRVAENPLVPHVMPAIGYPGADAEFDWRSVLPRLGATWAIGPQRETLVRASFAQFANQLGVWDVQRTNPAGYAYAYFALPWEDAPYRGDGSELDDPARVAFTFGFDRSDPTALIDPDLNDPGLDPPVTSELVLGVEHALLPELVLGLQLTGRLVDDVLEWRTLVRDQDGTVRAATRDDYVLDGILEGRIPGAVGGSASYDYRLPTYSLHPSLARTGGELQTNGGRTREYRGAALTVAKRLSRGWMARGHVHYGEAEWVLGEEDLQHLSPNRSRFGGDRDGDLYLQPSGGSRLALRGVQSSWSAALTGMVQVRPDRPWGFNVSASLQAREGHLIPFYVDHRTSDGVLHQMSVLDRLDRFRLDDLAVLDLRLEKEMAVSSAMGLTFGVDAFNITNEGTALSREPNLSTSTPFYLNDSVSPRIYRLGVRLAWK